MIGRPPSPGTSFRSWVVPTFSTVMPADPILITTVVNLWSRGWNDDDQAVPRRAARGPDRRASRDAHRDRVGLPARGRIVRRERAVDLRTGAVVAAVLLRELRRPRRAARGGRRLGRGRGRHDRGR